ncbi:MAG: hypothetical protein JJ974_11190 [Phycisphaerales bacterium]|nr:hypothetical protein [Phycisphaerales bacterium]
MARMTGCRVVELVVVSGCALGVAWGVLAGGGCGKKDRWWKKDKEPIVEDGVRGPEEVDTSLSALARDSEPVGIEGSGVTPRTTAEDFGSTRDRVLESARMMDEYFSGMTAENDLVEAVEIEDAGGGADSSYQTVNNSSVNDSDSSQEPIESAVDGTVDGSFSLSTALAERERESGGETGGTDEPGMADEGGTDPDASGLAEADAQQRKAELVQELVVVLTEMARTGEDPGRAVAMLAGMESMSVEVLEGLRDEGVLSDSELSTLTAVRTMFESVVSSGEIASPEEVGDLLTRLKDDLDRASGIRVARAVLCTRVDGFGRYEPFASNEFIAGRAQEVIVYVEVDRFAQRELTGTDGQPRYEVEMSQRLELYHVADDLNTWNRAAEVDRSVSRNRVRDYYLINKITLPANLGVGRYHLKVVMRDLVGERVGEAIIPIRMVVR